MSSNVLYAVLKNLVLGKVLLLPFVVFLSSELICDVLLELVLSVRVVDFAVVLGTGAVYAVTTKILSVILLLAMSTPHALTLSI